MANRHHYGSGFLLRDRLVVTNYHPINAAAGGYCKVVEKDPTYEIVGTVAVDAAHDLAIRAVTCLKATPLPMGDSGRVGVGNADYAIGNPEGLEGTFSQGIVSAVRREENAAWIS